MSKATSFSVCYLYLTENCNLQCKYCFENANRGKSYMPLDTAKKSVDFLIDNALKNNGKSVNIVLFGGEPLLNLDVMINVCHYAVDKGNEHNIEVRFPIITNGTIYNKKYEEFLLDLYKATNYVDIQISIDGIPEVQDKNRVFVNDKPTSAIVSENIIKLMTLFENNGMDTSLIRTHSVLTKNNISKLFLSFKYLNQLGIRNPEFAILNEEDWDENDISIYTEQLSLVADYIYQECISSCSLKPYHYAEGIIAQRKRYINEYTCAAGKTFCSIAPNGDIYPCHRIFSYNRGFKLGNVFDGIIDNDIRKKFFDTCRKDMHAGNNNCGECENSECIVCMAYNNEKYGDMLKCNPLVCSMFKTKWKVIVETKKRFDKLSDKLNYNKCNEMAFIRAEN